LDHEAAFRYIILALNTWARPEAICQLSVKRQIDFDRALVHLNPPGRLQNKKVRPTIRLTENLREWFQFWNLDYPIVYFGRAVEKVDSRTLKKAAKSAGLDPSLMNRYTLRHYMATRVRRVDGIPVSREERATWMGHVDPYHRTTEAWYESVDPDYLLNPARATDAIMLRLDQLAKRSLFSPNSRPSENSAISKTRTN
jgi:integrase